MFEGLDDDELISVMQFWDRVASSAAAAQLAAVAELARRRPRSYLDGPAGHLDAGDPSVPEISEFAVDEIAAALRLSRPAAGARLHVAVELTRLPEVSAALADGLLDVPMARAVVDAVAVLDADTAVAVSRQVLPRAARQTVGQLRSALSRAVLTADPTAAEARHERAVATRHVTLQPARDGMAELWALLPADAAVAVFGRIDAHARREAADGRPMDARRADALVTTVLGACPPAAASGEGASAATDRAATRITAETDVAASRSDAGPVIAAASVSVTVPVGTALGLDDEPGELAGYGPVPASMARRLAGTTTWRKITTDPLTGTVVEVGRTAYTPTAALGRPGPRPRRHLPVPRLPPARRPLRPGPRRPVADGPDHRRQSRRAVPPPPPTEAPDPVDGPSRQYRRSHLDRPHGAHVRDRPAVADRDAVYPLRCCRMTAGPDDRRAAVDERVADMRALSGREVVPLIHWYQQRCAGQRCLPDP